MSDVVTGADLDQLDALAQAYHERGAEIAAQAGDLNIRIVETVDAFRSALDAMRSQSVTANTALLADVDELVATAAATTWTGANRLAFDDDLVALRTGITTTTDSLTSRLDELARTGVEPFGGQLEAFGRQARTAGEAAEQTGADMRAGLGDQRRSLQDAADLGWAGV